MVRLALLCVGVTCSNEVLKTKGIKGFYKGWGSYTLLACKPAIQCVTEFFAAHIPPYCLDLGCVPRSTFISP